MFDGYIGKRFSKSRLVIFGVNPGGGKDTYIRHPEDDNLYKLLRKFEKANSKNCLNKFEAINEAFVPIVKLGTCGRFSNPHYAHLVKI